MMKTVRDLIASCTLCVIAAPVSADIIRSLQQDAETGAWSMIVPGWTATLEIESLDEMTATLALQPENGDALTATVDMMGPNLPTLLNLEEVLLCGEQPDIAVTVSDLIPEGENGTFVYRRFVYSMSGGFLGEVVDRASSEARGALPAAVVSNEMMHLCR